MKKKLFLSLITALLSTILLSTSAFAAQKQITDAYTTDGQENPKTVFAWDETPYLFSTFNFKGAFEKEVWVSPTLDTYSLIIHDNGIRDLDNDKKEILNTLPKWNLRKELGLWSWFARAANGSCGGQSLSGTFTVTPEPISSALFLLGGAALIGRNQRNKKRKV